MNYIDGSLANLKPLKLSPSLLFCTSRLNVNSQCVQPCPHSDEFYNSSSQGSQLLDFVNHFSLIKVFLIRLTKLLMTSLLFYS